MDLPRVARHAIPYKLLILLPFTWENARDQSETILSERANIAASPSAMVIPAVWVTLKPWATSTVLVPVAG